jgi:hypothetical protein
MQYNQETEERLRRLIATDRIHIPISSLSEKLKRRKPKLAQEIELPKKDKYNGERVYAYIETEDKMKARKMKEAIAEFVEKYPTHGKVLQGMIAEKRLKTETHLYFGVNEGCRLSDDDYMAVMKDLGFGEVTAKALYTDLIEISRNLAKKRGRPERSILIGKIDEEESEE